MEKDRLWTAGTGHLTNAKSIAASPAPNNASARVTANLKLSEARHWIASVVFNERDVKLSRSRASGKFHQIGTGKRVCV